MGRSISAAGDVDITAGYAVNPFRIPPCGKRKKEGQPDFNMNTNLM